MLNCFLENDLISPKLSGFRPGDSCINHLLSINHESLSASDIVLEVRGLFLDVSKALIKSGMLDWFLNCVKTVYVEIWLGY